MFVQEGAVYCANCGALLPQQIEPAISSQIQRSFLKISDIVATEFQIENAYLKSNTPTFKVAKPINLEEKAENLISKLRPRELEAKIGQSNKGIELQVFAYRAERDAPRRFFGRSLDLRFLHNTRLLKWY